MIGKVDSYAKYVKEMYWPKVSSKKRLEIAELKENLKNLKKSASTKIMKNPLKYNTDGGEDYEDRDLYRN